MFTRNQQIIKTVVNSFQIENNTHILINFTYHVV